MSRQQEPRSERTSSPGRTVDARQLWSGGAATAVVAALIALAGILVCRWLFGIPVLAPRQQMFFAWIIGLATVIAVVYPFSTTAPLSQKAATAVINLVLGAAIGSLINGTAARVIRRRAITGGYQPS